MRNHFCAICLLTEKHAHFTTPDDVMTLILFKFLYCSQKEYSKCLKKKLNTLFLFYKMPINAVAAQEHCSGSSWASIYSSDGQSETAILS